MIINPDFSLLLKQLLVYALIVNVILWVFYYNTNEECYCIKFC